MKNNTLNLKQLFASNPWLFIAVAVVYLISPIDIVPDFIPILGWADDIVVIFTMIQKYKKNKKINSNVIDVEEIDDTGNSDK